MKLGEWVRILVLTVKYWINGDQWSFANEYAKSIVLGFKKPGGGK